MLRVDDVTKCFARGKEIVKSLEKVTLNVQAGEFVSVVGPSGCGKSTLLNIMAGLDQASSGKVLINDREITGPGPDRMVIFQEAALFPWLNVMGNVEYGMKIKGIPGPERKKRAAIYLKMVHLSRFGSAYPHQLSGGMRQRVALARALAVDSDILLMDEPFAALDHQTSSILHREVQEIWHATGRTIIFVTHNLEEAVLLADRVILMGTNPGRIKKEFRIQLARPRDIENRDLAYMVSRIVKELKEEVEQVAKEEFDSGWSLEKTGFLPGADSFMGDGI